MATTEVEKAKAFLHGIDTNDAVLLTRHIDPARYVQHAKSATGDVNTLQERIARDPRQNHGLRLVRAFQDGAHVITQASGRILDQGVFFDVFRFENGSIVERWAFSGRAAPPNLSAHTQEDGPTEAEAGADTEGSKSLVRRYYEVVHIQGRHDQIPSYVWEGCIRHEPGVRDGMAAFIEDVDAATRRGGSSRSIDDIRLLLGQGDFVFITAIGSIEGNACAFVDLHRMEDDKIVEHWGFPEML